MKLIRSLIFFAIALSSSRALAFECHFLPDHTEVRIDDMEDTKITSACPQGVETHIVKPLVIYFQSKGGFIDHIQAFVDGVRRTALEARERSGVPMTIVVREECMSSCIPILAGLNQMAKEKLIELIVDPRTEIGFHGCSDIYEDEPKLRFTVEGTNRYLGYLAFQGANPQWIAQNPQLFATPVITAFLPQDPQLQNSGILDYAEIRSEP